MFGPGCGVRGPVVVEVVLGARHAKRVFQFSGCPLLAVVVVGIGGMGDVCELGARVHHVTVAIDALLLIAKISRYTQAITTVIQAQGKQLGALVFIVDGGVTFALRQVHAYPELVVGAKTLPQIQVLADPSITGNIRGKASGRGVQRALWLKINAAPHPRAGRCNAIDEGIRPFEHLYTFKVVS